ncbi:MAG: YfhO family protein [Candidatus Omnitrophica bacterium]|nr:YfhO family protein [Candidatus Omnitrophota bacterium]MDD5488606.1 YfhO family protein [Candidatus Omnitrophota bacterium]
MGIFDRKKIPTIKSAAMRFKDVVFFAVPFVVFYWIAPFISENALGLDYFRYPMNNQLELMFSIYKGSFPLYIPGYWGGMSSSALTLGQIFHPLPYVASVMPGYWTGYSLEWNTALRFLSMGFVQLMLFRILRRMGADGLPAFILSFIAIYNLKTLFVFRYGASLENYTAFIILIALLVRQYMKETKYAGPLMIAGATYLTICGGHPKVMYYALISVFLFVVMVPAFLRDCGVGTVDPGKKRRYYFAVFGGMSAGMLLSAAYAVPFYFSFLADNIDRVQEEIRYVFDPGTWPLLVEGLNAFFDPLKSSYKSSFGGSAVMAMAAVMPVLSIFKVKISRSAWILWSAMMFFLVFSIDPLTPIPYYMRKYLPLASGLRHSWWIGVVIPPLASMLLTWVFLYGDITVKARGKERRIPLYSVLAACAAVTMMVFWVATCKVPIHNVGEWDTGLIYTAPVAVRYVSNMAGLLSLAAVFLSGIVPGRKKLFLAAAVVLVLLQSISVLRYGTLFHPEKYSRTMMSMEREKKMKLSYAAEVGYGMASRAVSIHRDKGFFFESRLAELCPAYVPASSNEEDYTLMGQGAKKEGVAIVEGYVGDEVAKNGYDKDFLGYLNLVYSSFNRVEYDAVASANCFFITNYPYSPRWQASLDGKKAGIYRANGMEQAVFMPAGRHTIEMRYHSPASFWGMVISCATLFGLLVYPLSAVRDIRSRWISILAAGLFCSAIFLVWYNSLYTGRNLGTQYIWQSRDSLPGNVIDLGWEYGRKDSKEWLSDQAETNLKKAF